MARGKRRVFVTGASRGIGQAIARRFNDAGFGVVAPSRHELDLSSSSSVTSYLERSPSHAIDVLVNCAGENKINLIDKIALRDWQRILMTNLTSSFLLTQAFAPGMAVRGWGRIVNLSSCFSLLSRAGRAAYSASKSGLNGLTRTTAIEYGPNNVLANAVCPGFVETDMTRQNNSESQIADIRSKVAVNRLAQPGEIAEFVHFLGSEQNTYITGQCMVIDGGFSIQ